MRGGRGDDVPLDGDGDGHLLLHLARLPVPHEDPLVHGECAPAGGEAGLAVRVAVQHAQHEPLQLAPTLPRTPGHVLSHLGQVRPGEATLGQERSSEATQGQVRSHQVTTVSRVT